MSTSASTDELSHSTATPANPPTDFSPSTKTPPIYDSASKQFSNPWPDWHRNSLTAVMRYMWQGRGVEPLAGVNLDEALPVVKPQWGTDNTRVYYTWIGHATALVQMYGVNILIDPIFSERCSPVQFGGPKRYRPVPCTIDQLPPIDIVLISHNHYDHLDYHSCQQLAQRADRQRKESGRTMKWYVGKGIEQWLVSNCNVRSEDAIGLMWWQNTQHTLQQPQQPQQHDSASTAPADAQSVAVTAVPCQHFSVRNPLTDERRTLWCGFTLTHRAFTLFYSGDTAYCPAFKQIGQHTPNIDLAILPIGAYEPWWFMQHVHVAPAQAIDMMVDVKATKAVGVHWGTYILTHEPVMEPKKQLAVELNKRGIDENKFVTTKHGETILIK